MNAPNVVHETRFLPAERSGPEDLARQAGCAASEPLLARLMDACGGMTLLLNDQRQIIRANAAFLARLGLDGDEVLLGKRFGEAVDCVWMGAPPNGCGTTPACRNCGVAQASFAASVGRPGLRRARVRTSVCGEDLELDLRATPLKLGGERFVLLSAEDAAPESRRRALEAIFFHDVLNTATGVSGLVHVMADEPGLRERCLPVACRASDTLIEELESHRDLFAAERGELSVRSDRVETGPLLRHAAALFAEHSLARGRSVQVSPGAANIVLRTDGVLLARVLTNLIKNALEAEPKGSVVTLDCRREGLNAVLSVRNPAVMPPGVRDQVFQRSFSTKGPGRGLGTYSVRLLTEKYLRGRVALSSEAGTGTVVTVSLPIEDGAGGAQVLS